MKPGESPDDIATLAALDFPTPAVGCRPSSERAQTTRAAVAAVGVVILSLVLLALIIARPLLPPMVSTILMTLWVVALGITIYRLIRIGGPADS